MHFSLTTIQLIILTSSPTLASDYARPLHLVSRQSSDFCLPVFLEYPDTWTQCGSGYIPPDCNCCSSQLIGCLTLTQTCATDATGGSICCDNDSSDCLSTPGGGGGCATQGEVFCGGSVCLPAGYACCPNDPNHGGCPPGQYCCSNADGTPSCCAPNTDITTPTSEAAPTSAAAATSTESINSGTGSSTTTSATRTSNVASSTAISGPSSSISSSSSTRVYLVGAARGSHSFIFQSAMPFIVINYFLLVGIFA